MFGEIHDFEWKCYRQSAYWGTVGTLHAFFTIKSTEGEVAVKCDFLCYVRVNDDVSVEGEFRENNQKCIATKLRADTLKPKQLKTKH